MRLVWSAELETGVRTIDLQHQELISMINELHDVDLSSVSLLVVEDILQRLDAYIAFHFGSEEALMAGLPGEAAHVSEHLRQHGVFVDQIADMRKFAEIDRASAISNMAEYLSGWLYEHILKTDRQLAAKLNARTASLRS